MKTKIKDVYYCDHCKKHGLSRLAMVKHENVCYLNPINAHPCRDCRWMEAEGVYNRCRKLDVYLHSRIAQEKKLPERYPHDFKDSQQMPSECKEYQKDIHSH